MSTVKDVVYVVMAQETSPESVMSCYCVCDSRTTAEQVIEQDTNRGDIHPGATVEIHVIQTPDMV